MATEAMVAGSHDADALDLSILVVSYNTRDLTAACLRSVHEHTRRATFEVIVVDNASSDGSAGALREAFPAARVIASEQNLGFAAGCNLAASHARGEHLLLLNPDTQVTDDAISVALDALRGRDDVGALGVRTLYADGTLNATSCFGPITLWGLFSNAVGLSVLFPDSPVFNTLDLGGWKRDDDREVATITGCFLMISRSLWNELGGFDERFFMYSEDVDLSTRIRATGRRCLHFAGVDVVHHGGQSEKIRAEKMAKVHGARVQFMRKHWNPLARWVGIFLLDLGVGLRALAYSLVAPFRATAAEKRDTWVGVWRTRDQWHRLGLANAAASFAGDGQPREAETGEVSRG